MYKVDILDMEKRRGGKKRKRKKRRKKKKKSRATRMLRGICGRVDFGRALPSRVYTRRELTERETHTCISVYNRMLRATYVILYVYHARCRMLCALPVTRILNTKFNFFFFFLHSLPSPFELRSQRKRDRISLDQFLI